MTKWRQQLPRRDVAVVHRRGRTLHIEHETHRQTHINHTTVELTSYTSLSDMTEKTKRTRALLRTTSRKWRCTTHRYTRMRNKPRVQLVSKPVSTRIIYGNTRAVAYSLLHNPECFPQFFLFVRVVCFRNLVLLWFRFIMVLSLDIA